MLVSILTNYALGQQIKKDKNQTLRWRQLWLVMGVALNLGILGYFKYTDFLISNLNWIPGVNIPLLHLVLPLGISFYTFQQLSYLIDSYCGNDTPCSLCDYCLFVTFFPQLVAGPIVLPGEMLPQFAKTRKSIDYALFDDGLFLFSCGLAKKCFVADTIAILADVGFDSKTVLTMGEAWIVTLAFTLQLYFDFSGYCDMAAGIARFFGIILPLNFNSPYKSANFQEFWRRWHITLGRFMTNYLYIPLGGNRHGTYRTLFNLFLVFIASGFWHGAGWLFLLWGMLHGICIIVHRIWCQHFAKKCKINIPNSLSIAVTFLLCNLFWIFFRSKSFARALSICGSLMNFKHCRWLTSSFCRTIDNSGNYTTSKLLVLMSIALLVVFILPNSSEMLDILKKYRVLRFALTVGLFVLGFLCLGQDSPFLYFNF